MQVVDLLVARAREAYLPVPVATRQNQPALRARARRIKDQVTTSGQVPARTLSVPITRRNEPPALRAREAHPPPKNFSLPISFFLDTGASLPVPRRSEGQRARVSPRPRRSLRASGEQETWGPRYTVAYRIAHRMKAGAPRLPWRWQLSVDRPARATSVDGRHSWRGGRLG